MCTVVSHLFLYLIFQQTTASLQRAVIYAQPQHINPIHDRLKRHLPFLILFLALEAPAQKKKKITLEALGWHWSLRWCKIQSYTVHINHLPYIRVQGCSNDNIIQKNLKCPLDPEKILFNLVPGLYTTHEQILGRDRQRGLETSSSRVKPKWGPGIQWQLILF